MAKTFICRLGAGAGVRRCAGGGAALKTPFTQSPPTPSARGVGGAASAVPQWQGVAAAPRGSLAAEASWQPSASRLVRQASAAPSDCSPAPGFRPLHPSLLRSVGQRPGQQRGAHAAWLLLVVWCADRSAGLLRGRSGRQLCTTSMLPSGVAAASERHRIATQVDSCARGGRAFVGVARMHAATPCSLVPACPECCEASKGTPLAGGPRT